MSNNIDAPTTFSMASMAMRSSMTMMMALFAALAASACDAPDEPGSLAATDDVDRAGRRGAPGRDERDERLTGAELQEGPPPAGFYIKKVTTLGKGCPDPASVTVLMSPDKTAMRIIYHQMVLKKPAGGLQTTNCQAVLSLHIPAGYQVALASLSTRGFAGLEPKIKARRHTNVFFAGDPMGVDFDTNLMGPYSDYYQAKEELSPDEVTWSPCGGSAILGINNSLVLNGTANPGGNAFINLHNQRLVSWQFKKC